MADIKFVNPATYLKNVTKSISYSALDITKEMMPAGADLIDTNGETLKEVITTIRQPKKSLKTLSTAIKKSKVYEAGELAVKATLEDIATGNFYNKERINQVFDKSSGEFGDFSDLEIDFDELDKDIAESNKEEERVTKGDKFVGEMISESSFASSQAVSKAVVATGQYVAQTNKASSTLMYNLNVKGFEMLGKGVSSVNQNIANLVNFTNVTIKDYMQKTLQQHDKMLKLQEEQTVLLKNIHDMQSALQSKPIEQRNPKAGRYEDVMSGGTLDIKEYAKLVSNNIMENTPLKILNSMNDSFGEGSNILLNFAAAPMKTVTDYLVKKAIPDMVKESMESFNNTLSGFFGTILYRLSTAGNDGEGFIGEWVRKIFGVKTSIKSSIDTSRYQKGPIPFDGVTKKAIIETIPGYLARIESAITGMDERFFDYKNGSWKDYEDIQRETSNIKQRSVDSATGNVKREIEKKAISKSEFESDLDLRDFRNDLNKLMNSLYDNKGKFFSPTDKNLQGSDFDISDKNLRRIQAYFKTLPREMQTSIYGNIMSARDQQNKTMFDLENSGDSIFGLMYNNSGSLNNYDKKTGKRLASKNGIGNLANQTDQYGKNVFDWLKYQSERLVEISNNTLGSISSGKSGDSNLKETNVTFNDYDSKGIGLRKVETIDEKLKKESIKEYEKLFRENQKYINTLKEKGIDVLDPKKFEDKDLDDGIEYRNELIKNIKVIEALEKKSDEKDSEKRSTPNFIQKLKGYMDKPGQLISDIFKKGDERLYSLMFGDTKDLTTVNGQPVKSVLGVMKGEFELFFSNLTEKINKILDPIFKKIKEVLDPFLDKAKEVARPLFESTKDAFKSAGNWVKGSFSEVYSPIKNLFDNSQGTWGTTTRVKNIDDVDMLADGTRMMDKTGLAILSEGEMVIPQRLNPFYKGKRTSTQQQKRNENLVKNNLISRFASNVAKSIPSYAEGTTDAKPSKDPKYLKIDGKWYNYETEEEVSREEIEKYNVVNQTAFGKAGEQLISGTKNIFDELRQIIIGDDSKLKINKLNSVSSELFNEALGDIKGDKIGYGGKAIAGSVIGAGASLLTGGIVSPLIGAALGSATSMVVSSEKVRNWLFGTEDENGEFKQGSLPKKLVDGIKQYVPSMAKHGAVGALTAMLPFVPGGPIAGLLVGSSVGFIKQNQAAQDWLFGEEGLFGKSKEEISKSIKEKLPNILGGAGLGAATGFVLGGPFGLVGNMMIGGGLGFLSTNKKFQDAIFGEKDDNGKTIKDGLVQKLGKWVKKNVLDQLKDFIKPLTNRLFHFVERLGKGSGGFFSRQFEKWVGIPLGRALNEYLFKPMSKIAKPFLGLGKIFIKAAVSPLSLLGGIGRRMQRKDLKRGLGGYLGNAEERLKRREELGMSDDDIWSQIDKGMAGMSIDELKEASSTIESAMQSRVDNESNRKKARKELTAKLSKEMSGDFKIRDIIKITNLVNNGKAEEAAKLIQSGKINLIGQKSRFARAKNTDEIMQIFNDYGSNLSDAVQTQQETEKGIKKSLESRFGKKAANRMLKDGGLGDLKKMLDKEASSRSPEQKAFEESEKKENKFRDKLLDDIKAIRDVLTGVKKPKDFATETVENVVSPTDPDSQEGETEGEEKKPAIMKKLQRATDGKLSRKLNPKRVAKDQAKMNQEVENASTEKTSFTTNGPIHYLRDSTGRWTPDKNDKTTRETLKDENAEDENLLKTASFTEKIANFFGIQKKEEDEEESGGLLGKILGKGKDIAGGILKKVLGGVGLLTAGGAAIAGVGYGTEKIRQTQIGSKIMDWLFGGTDEEGNKQEGVLTKVGKVLITKIPEISSRIGQFITDSIINMANYVNTHSEQVGQWITTGIQLFTNNIVRLLEKAPVIAEALGNAIPLIINPIGRAIPPMITSLAENVGPVLSALGDALPAIGSSLANAVGTLVSQIPTILKALWNAAKGVVPSLAKTVFVEMPKALIHGILHPDEPYESSTKVETDKNGTPIVDASSIGIGQNSTNNNFSTLGYNTTSTNNNYSGYYGYDGSTTNSTQTINNLTNDTGTYDMTPNSVTATNYVEDTEPATINVRSEDGSIQPMTFMPGEEGYEAAKQAIEQAELAEAATVGKSSGKSAESLVISAVHAARLGLISTPKGQKFLASLMTKNPTLRDAIAKRIGKSAGKGLNKFTKGTVKLELSAMKLAKKIVYDNPKARKAIMKEAAKNAEQYTVKGIVKEAASKVAKPIKSKGKEVSKKLVDLVVNNVKKGFKKLIENPMIAKYLGKASKGCDKFLAKILKKIPSAVGKAGGKLAAGLMSGGLFNALLAAYKFSDGMANAEGYLKIEDATLGQRVICGLALAINEFVLFGLLPEDILINLLLETVGKALGIDEETRAQQEELKVLTEEYNKQEGTDYTVEEYNSKVLDNKTGFKGFMSNVAKFFKSGTTKSVSARNERENRSSSTTSNSNRYGYSAKGTGISSLIEEIDPTAPKPILSQLDPRIAKKKFGNSTVGESGCAPSSAAIILNDIMGNNSSLEITDTMKPALKYQNSDGSIGAEYFKDIFSKYGYKADYIEKRERALAEIKNGQELILLGEDDNNKSKLKSPFGGKSHFVVASDYKNGKVTIADPETGQQALYDKGILNSVDLAVAPRGKGKSGSGSGLNLRSFAGSGGLTNSQVQQNKDVIFNYLVTNMGLSTAAAVGIMTNIKHESGFNPGQMEYGYSWEGGAGYGLCQWTDYPRTAGKGNRTKLVKFARSKGKDKSDMVLQLDFLKQQLESGYGQMMTRMRSYPNTEEGAGEAAKDFCVTYERPANKASTGEKRRKASKELWAEYKNRKGGPVTGSYSSSSSSSDSIGNLFSGLTSELMKNYYGEDVLSLFGMSADTSSGDESASGEIITNSNATTAKKWFTDTLKGKVTSNYGKRVDPVYGGTAFHGGIDIGANRGTKIPSPVSGTVDAISTNSGYGNLLVLKDKDSYFHYFGHMQKKPTLHVGDSVSKGQEVGLVGSTGKSTGNHLHYEVRKPNRSDTIDPDSYLESYFNKGGSGSGLVSPYRNIGKEKFNPNGPKGGGDSTIIDIKILESLVSVISKILDDTHNIGQIKELLAEYLSADKELSTSKDKSKAKARKQKAKDNIVNVISTSSSNSNGDVDERKQMILQQLQTLISN